MIDENADLRSVLPSRDPPGRDALRRVLIRDQATATKTRCSYFATETPSATNSRTSSTCGTMNPEERRKVVRLLAEIDARTVPPPK